MKTTKILKTGKSVIAQGLNNNVFFQIFPVGGKCRIECSTSVDVEYLDVEEDLILKDTHKFKFSYITCVSVYDHHFENSNSNLCSSQQLQNYLKSEFDTLEDEIENAVEEIEEKYS